MEEMAKKQDKNELESLRKEVEIYKKHFESGDENVIEKVKEYNTEIEELRKRLDAKNNELSKAKRRTADLERKVEISDKEIAFLKEEIEGLKDEVETQKQGISEHLNENQDPFEKLREKNKQIEHLLEEINEMEKANMELAKQVKNLKEQLKVQSVSSKSIDNEIQSLKTQLSDVHETNSMLVKENEFLLKETNNLRDVLENYEKEDDLIASKFSERVDKLLNVLKTKENEIADLKVTLQQTTSLINDANKESLLNEIQKKNGEIKALRKELDSKIDKESMQKSSSNCTANEQFEVQISTLKESVSKLEDELRAKDEELLEVRKRNIMYEKGEYGLFEALQEVKQLKRDVNNRDAKIEDFVKQLNEMSLELNDTQDELDYIRECAQLDANTQFTLSKDKKSVNDKLKILKLQKMIVKLEDEKIASSEEIRQLKAYLHNDDRGNESLLKHIQELKKENKELELGMKEILIGIRESDAKCDVVIECPSLERLCQLLESRSLSPDLTNVIALKAELDLLRGHNQQLRMELKRMRIEHLKLLKLYTTDVLNETSAISDESSQQQVSDDSSQKESSERESSMLTIGESISPEANTTSEQMEEEKKEQKLTQDSREASLKEETDAKEDEPSNLNEQLPLPKPRRRTPKQIDIDTQTEFDYKLRNEEIDEGKIDKVLTETATQTEAIIDLPSATTKCSRCQKIQTSFKSLEQHLNKVEQTFLTNEQHFNEEISFLQNENLKLKNDLKECLKRNEEITEKELFEKDVKDDDLKSEDDLKSTNLESSDEQSGVDFSFAETPTAEVVQQPKSAGIILQTIINCLQARIEHKNEALKQYETLLEERQTHYELEMRKFIDDQQQQSDKELRPINFNQIIDNNELQSALEKCVHEFEKCKNEYEVNINRLENEIANEKLKVKEFEEENEKLRLKSSVNKYIQLKKEIERLESENQEKTKYIEKLQKTLKDERAMRSATTVTVKANKQKSDVKDADGNTLRKQLNEVLNEVSQQKETIKELEMKKWALEKKVAELSESLKVRLKQKSDEVQKVEKDLQKVKKLFEKCEKEKFAIEDRLNKTLSKIDKEKEPSTADNKLVDEMNKLSEEKTALSLKLESAQKDLEHRKQNEQELKVLLAESMQREKLSTISEDDRKSDDHFSKLLQENAQLKVELRMAEYELQRKNSSQF
ncbi:hypothetical protein B4U80_13118 [Leptotrombidium deliense]|uniref:Uncharacterized protein n=1 Tax=Leptotrombidium deliense TaxID=299467 RepID=A0A443SUV5_9ACAR|nr:hypothetical protein B4U80_13118 [Leptotrombidium deliense]